MEIVDGVFQLRIYLELISSILPQTITIHLIQIELSPTLLICFLAYEMAANYTGIFSDRKERQLLISEFSFCYSFISYIT